ncbi:hypothetical protein ACFX1Q_020944 [Malus domestica]
MEEKHRERYNCDPHYRLLHDRAMDVFVERLKSDIEKMKNKKLGLKSSDYLTDDEDDSMEDDSVIRPIDADAFVDLYVPQIVYLPYSPPMPTPSTPLLCLKALPDGFSLSCHNRNSQINHQMRMITRSS